MSVLNELVLGPQDGPQTKCLLFCDLRTLPNKPYNDQVEHQVDILSLHHVLGGVVVVMIGFVRWGADGVGWGGGAWGVQVLGHNAEATMEKIVEIGKKRGLVVTFRAGTSDGRPPSGVLSPKTKGNIKPHVHLRFAGRQELSSR